MVPNTTVVNACTTFTNIVIVEFNPSFQLTIKLAGTHNFTTSKAYVSLLMYEHNLFGHIDSTTVASPISLKGNNETTSNPPYMNWFRKNQLVQNSILASVQPTFASTIATITFAQKP